MEKEQVEKSPEERTSTDTPDSSTPQTESKPKPATEAKDVTKTKKPKRKVNGVVKKTKGKKKVVSSSEDESSESSDDSDSDAEDTVSESSEESETETEKEKKKRKAREKRQKQKAKEKKKARAKRKAREEASESGSEEDSEEEESEEEDEVVATDPIQQAQLLQTLQQIQQQLLQQTQIPPQGQLNLNRGQLANIAARRQAKLLGVDLLGKKAKKEKKEKKKRASKLEYKRVDQLWDSTIHNYKLTDTAEDVESSEYDQYLFNVRRTFDWEGKYKTTFVDIKSKLLKEALNEAMDGVKGVSLVEDTPVVDPNLLFLYLEDLRKAMKELKSKMKSHKMKKKLRKRNELKIKHVKVLLKYLDKDYSETKKTLYPMLESGLITFELLWALFKPGTLAYTTTYGTIDEPRAFKVEYAEKEFSFMKGEWYNIEGKYLEYDGKTWGMGTMDCDVPSFKGARKITSLACYPLKYHKNEAKLRADLIERGKKFVSLQGVHYKSHEGLAYTKKKRQVIKTNISGRIMVDPATHRRLWPNYQVSTVKPQDLYEGDEDEDEDSDDGCSCESDDGDDRGGDFENIDDEERTKLKVVFDDKRKPHIIEVPVDADGQEVKVEKLEEIASKDAETKEDTKGETKEEEEKKALPVFTDEQYLIASPVVLGFAFSEKQWLEFTVSGIKDISWNEGAYESLVLEENSKKIVKALVEEHKYNATDSIDDVIQGKGKGLVAVLHGPPGTGKTLTAEGISEHLKCPLYMVSAGELPTDPRFLEGELQRILDIAHAWGAVLLLDEADVFLEKRTIQDIHRNALVSVFLRLLEYFQGILFLTTNRVETFDEAFQSRIHIAIRYGALSLKAKKSIFKMFVERVRVHESLDQMPFTEDDYSMLARHDLNGREIKNVVRLAQVLAKSSKKPLDMAYVKQVIDQGLAFHNDFRGGLGADQAKLYF